MNQQWRVLKVTLLLQSPLHLGELQTGVMATTRRFLYPRNLWGALTSVITKTVMASYSDSLYELVGRVVQEHMWFSMFFLKDLGHQTVYFPYFSEEGYRYLEVYDQMISKKDAFDGKYISPFEYDQRFIDSRITTAIDPTTFSNEDNGLYETEYIKEKGIGLIGYLYYKQGSISLLEEIEKRIKRFQELNLFDIKDFRMEQEACKVLASKLHEERCKLEFNDSVITGWIKLLEFEGIGGHITRGYGRVKTEVEVIDPMATWFGKTVKLPKKDRVRFLNVPNFHNDRNYVLEDLSETKNIIVHPVPVEKFEDLKGKVSFYGDFQPVVGREWVNNVSENDSLKRGAGQRLTKGHLVVTPGSSLQTGRF